MTGALTGRVPLYRVGTIENAVERLADERVAGGIDPPLIFIGLLATGVIVNIFLRLWISTSPWNFLAGGIFMMLALWLNLEAVRALRRHNTPSEPSKPTSQLVQDGPYRLTRNPIYLSYAIFYGGLAFVFNSLPALVLLVPFIVAFDRTQVLREEEYLEGRFGEEYRRYKGRVRRWV